MSLTKVNYIDNETIITAKNLNDIQNNVIQNAELIKKVTPRNLLDNSDFRNPVMQAGFDGWHGTVRYPIDRWYDRYGFGMFTKTDQGITVAYGTNHGYFNQKIANADKLIGKTLTLAVCKYDGTIIICNGIFTGSGMSLAARIEGENIIAVDNDYVQICIVEGSVVLQWAALYECEYTIDTLPEYQPKGYGAELVTCRTYYRKDEDVFLVLNNKKTLVSLRGFPGMRVAPTIDIEVGTSYNVNMPGIGSRTIIPTVVYPARESVTVNVQDELTPGAIVVLAFNKSADL